MKKIIGIFAFAVPGLLGFSLSFADTSLIPNSDFSQLDNQGQPIGWKCVCQEELAACAIQSDSHGVRTVTLQPGCDLISGVLNFANPNEALRLSVNITGSVAHFQDFRLLTRNKSGIFGSIETGHPSTLVPVSGGSILLSDPISPDGSSWAALQIENTQSTPLVIQKADVIQGGAKPAPKTATLLKATHLTVFEIQADSNVKEIWVPLPLDYASQVPLWISLTAEPLLATESVRYTQDKVGNWGAIVTLKDGVQTGTKIRLEWEGIVLTRSIDEAERPSVFQATFDPKTWTTSTRAAESDDPGISQLAKGLVTNIKPSLDQMLAIIDWTSRNIHGAEFKGLDASSVFQSRNSSCTGFANLASAMGRAVGLPTHTMANYLVGMPQQTHSINEFYLGPELGWRRIEPQANSPGVTEDYGIMVRIVLPQDEDDSFQKNMFPGIPNLTLETILNNPGANIGYIDSSELFPDCPFCDNRGEHWQDLRGSRDDMKNLFERARSLWKTDSATLLSKGALSRERQAIRAQALQIKNIDDLRSLLKSLEAQ